MPIQTASQIKARQALLELLAFGAPEAKKKQERGPRTCLLRP